MKSNNLDYTRPNLAWFYSFLVNIAFAHSFQNQSLPLMTEFNSNRRLETVKGMRVAVFQVHMEGNLGDEMETYK